MFYNTSGGRCDQGKNATFNRVYKTGRSGLRDTIFYKEKSDKHQKVSTELSDT